MHKKLIKVALLSLMLSLVAIGEVYAQDKQNTEEAPASSEPSTVIKHAGAFGVGVGLGTSAVPLSAKYFFTDHFSFQFQGPFWGVWWGFGLGLSTDFLYESSQFLDTPSLQLAWEFGGGMDFYWYSNTYNHEDKNQFNSYGVVGVHLTGGIQLLLKSIPMDFVLEYQPGLYFSRWAEGAETQSQNLTNYEWAPFFNGLQFSIAARYYF